jgi:ferritin-like metal-binding protein YciE
MINSPQELLVHELHDIENAEMQASEALQRLRREINNKQIDQMIERRLKQGERLLGEVRNVVGRLNGSSPASQNAAARGLIQEAEKLLRNVRTPELKQAAAIAGVQKLEHYCIAAWGTVKAVATEMGEHELAGAMQRALEEGYNWDRELTDIAERRVNPSAVQSEAENERTDNTRQSQEESGTGSNSSNSSSGSDRDLNARAYRGEDGRIHHHTHSYMERRSE